MPLVRSRNGHRTQGDAQHSNAARLVQVLRGLRVRHFVPILLFLVFGFEVPAASAQNTTGLNWLDRASRTRAQQPDWVTPLFTASANLEEATINDVTRKLEPNGTPLLTVGDTRGVQFVPFGQIQITFGDTPYLFHYEPREHDGFGDTSFAVKYRFASGNAENGNFAFSGLVDTSIPTGSYQNGQRSAVMTPTLLGEKAWGNFDIQTAAGISLPLGTTRLIGRQIGSNTAFQYRIGRLWIPEFETNVLHSYGTAAQDQTQLYLTPGLLVGRFHLTQSAGLTFGVGMQIAATHDHSYNHNLIFSVRIPLQSPRSRWAPRAASCGTDCRNEDRPDPVAQEMVQ
jgi:hypothetical protein